jgi:hypothetical protein
MTVPLHWGTGLEIVPELGGREFRGEDHDVPGAVDVGSPKACKGDRLKRDGGPVEGDL